jgi:hypothetical protein
MKWKNAVTDGPPQDKEQVLISVEGVYYIATYHAPDRLFRVYDQIAGYFFIDKQLIYWTEFHNPPGVE